MESLLLKQLGPAPITAAKLKVNQFELVHFSIICLLCIETFLSLLLIAGADILLSGHHDCRHSSQQLHSLSNSSRHESVIAPATELAALGHGLMVQGTAGHQLTFVVTFFAKQRSARSSLLI